MMRREKRRNAKERKREIKIKKSRGEREKRGGDVTR